MFIRWINEVAASLPLSGSEQTTDGPDVFTLLRGSLICLVLCFKLDIIFFARFHDFKKFL
jgi:hypothetical protein